MNLETDPKAVISHWHQLIEGLNASSTAFYDSVQAALSTRCIPDITVSRVEYQEAGLMSANRLYLHAVRGRQVVDICAAPFGTGFFISSWLADTRPCFPLWTRLLAYFSLLFVFYILAREAGILLAPFLFVGLLFAGFWMVNAGRVSDRSTEDFVLALPWIGRLYERFFLADTYYAIDTALMFRDAVHNAVLEAVDGLTNQHGLRALSEAQRVPTSRRIVGPAE